MLMRCETKGTTAVVLCAALMLATTSAHAVVNYESFVQADSPLRYYRLGEAGGGTAFDATGNQNASYDNFSPANFSQASGTVGTDTSVRFDGVNNQVTAAHDPALNITGDITIEFWMNKASNPGDWARLVGKGEPSVRTFGVWEESGAGERILFQQYNGSGGAILNLFSSGTVGVGTWHHVVATVSGNQARIYIDGQLDAQGTRGGPVGTDTAPLTIGKASNIHTFYNGLMDEVAIYNHALTAGKVHAHYLVGSGAFVPGDYGSQVLGDNPTAYYRYEAPFHPTIGLDSTANGFNGTPNGGGPMPMSSPKQRGDYAASFDGVDDFIQVPSGVFGAYPTAGNTSAYALTFETWFKTGADGVILGQVGGDQNPGTGGAAGWVPAVYVGTDGLIRAQMFWHGSVAPITSTDTFNDDEWHHLVTTYDGGLQQLFIDGELIGTKNGNQTAYNALYEYYLGTGYAASWPGGNGGWFFYDGKLDETAFYNRALSNEEILLHYLNGTRALVPEPATMSLLGLAGLALFRRRRAA